MIVWALPLIILQFFSLDFFLKIDRETYFLIVSNILSFFLIYKLCKLSIKNNVKKKILQFDKLKISAFFKLFFSFWLFFYLVTIIYSGGVPLIWIIKGSTKTYDEFGVPTLTGLLNMIRAFLSVLCLIMWIDHKNKIYFYGLIFFIFSSFILEANRGGGLVLLLHPIGYYFLTRPLSIKRIFISVFFSFVLLLFLGAMEQYRYIRNDKYDIKEKYENLNISNSTPSTLQIYMLPAFLYITTPIQNLNNTIINHSNPTYIPYYTFSALLPTVIRDKIYNIDQKDYGDLLSETYNTTSYYTPLIRDFGTFSTFFIILLFQFIISIVHIKAKLTNQYFYNLIFPVLFMCILLTPFNLYFTSLVTVLYPVITYMFIHLKKIVLR
jgi:oligosaccharide repeat unit polymerase